LRRAIQARTCSIPNRVNITFSSMGVDADTNGIVRIKGNGLARQNEKR
jgi:hypothetical protein